MNGGFIGLCLFGLLATLFAFMYIRFFIGLSKANLGRFVLQNELECKGKRVLCIREIPLSLDLRRGEEYQIDGLKLNENDGCWSIFIKNEYGEYGWYSARYFTDPYRKQNQAPNDERSVATDLK